jgi:16S rRNA (cytosine1402-N4)-methyltransferase
MHKSVLLLESINYLNLKENSIIVDCTLGYGGHSSEILKRIKKGFLYAFDQDREAINYSQEYLSKIANNYEIIYNREEAIKKGIEMLKSNDILLILGKGHETYQIIGKEKLPFDDWELAKKYISSFLKP